MHFTHKYMGRGNAVTLDSLRVEQPTIYKPEDVNFESLALLAHYLSTCLATLPTFQFRHGPISSLRVSAHPKESKNELQCPPI